MSFLFYLITSSFLQDRVGEFFRFDKYLFNIFNQILNKITEQF